MSDYFGALMRSSALSVGKTAPAVDAGTSRPAGDTFRSAPAGDPFMDIAEMDAEHLTDSPRHDASLADDDSNDAAGGRRSSPGQGSLDTREVSSRQPDNDWRPREPQDFARLQRAAVDAALRWVTLGPTAAHGDAVQTPPTTSRAAEPPEEKPASDRRTVSVVEHVTTQAVAPVFTRTSQEGVSMAQLEIGRRDGHRPIDAPTPSPSTTSAKSSIEDVVEVSIGSVHVHVDGAPQKAAPPARRSTGGRQDRPIGSGLDRRYLRAI